MKTKQKKKPKICIQEGIIHWKEIKRGESYSLIIITNRRQWEFSHKWRADLGHKTWKSYLTVWMTPILRRSHHSQAMVSPHMDIKASWRSVRGMEKLGGFCMGLEVTLDVPQDMWLRL
jgi:hypothetical protein